MVHDNIVTSWFSGVTHSHISHWCAGYRGEGWFDPWMLLSSFKKKAISLGVDFIPGDVTGISVEGNKVKSIEVHNSG